jgi:hypothetical protein
MSITPFSHIARNKYESYAEAHSALPYLCKSASFTEFKTELEKYSEGNGLNVRYFMSDTDDNGTPMFFHVFRGSDYIRKTDWLLEQIPADFFHNMYLSLRDPVSKQLLSEVIVSTPGLQEVFEKHDYVFTEMEGFGHKTNTFEWNGFTILNAGFKASIMEEVLEELQPSIDRIKKFGFGKILYNPIVFVSAPMRGQVYNQLQQQYQKTPAAGYYDVAKDNIVIKAEFWGQKNVTPRTFVHELGHRQYYKILSNSQRQRWELHFKNRQKDISAQDISDLKKLILSCTPKIQDTIRHEEFPDFSRFNYRTFTTKLRQNLGVKEVLDFIVQREALKKDPVLRNIKTLRREYFEKIFDSEADFSLAGLGKNLPYCLEALETQKLNQKAILASMFQTYNTYLENKYKLNSLSGEEYEITKKFAKIEAYYEFAVEYLRLWGQGFDYYIGRTIRLPHSSSKYGENNPREDYAEAFEHFIHNKEMPADIFKEFVNLNNIRLGSKTAKLSSQEELKINALQRKIDDLYRKKDYEEAENLEEKLETLLNELEAREEHLDLESDESEDFYGWKNRLTQRPNLVPDLDDEHSNPSLEEELAKLYFSWIKDDGMFEDTDARKNWQNAHPGSTWEDVPQELQKSEKVFVEIVQSIIGDTYPSHMDDQPRKDITFEEALAAAKDAYESVTKRRDRTRELLKKGKDVYAKKNRRY